MKLFRQVIRQLCPADLAVNDEPRYNGYYNVVDTIYDDAIIDEYLEDSDNEDTRYYCGAYISPTKGIYAIAYEPVENN